MNIKTNVIWNTVGTMFFLAAQWLTTVLIVRITNNYEDAGLYSLAMSISNIFYIIAIYNVRTFQVSDIHGQYRNEDYISHRFCVVMIALLSCMIFSAVVYKDARTRAVLIVYMIYRLGEALVDVLHGIDQKHDRMDIVGKSYLIRGTVMLLSFCVCEMLFADIFITILVMAVTAYGCVFLFDVSCTKRLVKLELSFDLRKIRSLFVICFPLLIYGITLNLNASLPRILFEKMQGKELLGYYSSVATPAVIVQSLTSVIFAPFVTTFTRYYNEKNRKAFISLTAKITALCGGIGFVSYMGSVVLGKFVLSKILYPDSGIEEYCYLLNSTMICTVLMAFIWFIALLLTIDRANWLLSGATLSGAVLELVIGYLCIDRYKIDGINRSLIITYLFVIAVLCTGAVVRLKKHFS